MKKGPLNNLKRYDLYGWDYEFLSPLTEKEIEWYAGFTKEPGGPVLELACGTGRLVAKLAKQNIKIDGLDLSKRMLDIAQNKINGLPENISSFARLFEMDMSDFKLNKNYGLVIIADNSFRELETHEKMLSCLECISKHLKPDGKLLITERRFDSSLYKNGKRLVPWSAPVISPLSGNKMTRKMEIEIDENNKMIEGTMFYKTVKSDGPQHFDECDFKAPIMYVDDYIVLFEKAGFKAEVYNGYEKNTDDGKDPVICFICEKSI